MLKSIRSRIALPYILLMLLTMAFLGMYVSGMFSNYYLEELKSRLNSETILIGEALEPYLSAGSTPDEINALAHLWAEQTGARVTIVGTDGKVIGESDLDPASMENHSTRPEIAQALQNGQGSITRHSTSTDTETVYFASLVRVNGVPAAVVRLAVNTDQARDKITRLLSTIIATTLLASFVAILLAIWIASSTTRPIRQLTETATQLANSLLSTPESDEINPAITNEVEMLTQAFNRMSGRLRTQLKSLESERSKTQAVLQAMTEGVLIVDSNGIVQMINPAAEKMFATSGSQVLSHSLAEGLRYHQLVELWQQCQKSGQTQSALIEISAESLFLQGTAIPLHEALPGSTLMVLTNLSRQRYLETVRRDFVSNISHELRTPLASLKALTETLQSGALDDPPAAQRFLQRMETEVDALTQMVAELLELSRIESGRVPMEMRQTRAQDIITSSVDRLRMQAERARLKLIIDLPEDLPEISADPARLEQVMVNLLHNAIKFTPPGGEICIRARTTVDESTQKPVLIFSVQDTGVGIPADMLPRIFERFYKGDRARSGGGTGLGLAIARHTVEAHQGKIWAESETGKGSTFYFSIPIS